MLDNVDVVGGLEEVVGGVVVVAARIRSPGVSRDQSPMPFLEGTKSLEPNWDGA